MVPGTVLVGSISVTGNQAQVPESEDKNNNCTEPCHEKTILRVSDTNSLLSYTSQLVSKIFEYTTY